MPDSLAFQHLKKNWSRDMASQEQRMVGLKSYGAQRWTLNKMVAELLVIAGMP